MSDDSQAVGDMGATDTIENDAPPETLYFVDGEGNFLGGFCGAEPPSGAIQVSSIPRSGKQKYISGKWQEYYVDDALAELAKVSTVATRCIVDGTEFPQSWRDHAVALRAIVNGAPGPLPDRPDYPS